MTYLAPQKIVSVLSTKSPSNLVISFLFLKKYLFSPVLLRYN